MHVRNALRLSALFFLFAIGSGHASGHPSCTALVTTCSSDANCGPLVGTYRTNCLAELQGSSTTCSTQCKNAWSALLINAIGKDFATCTCPESDVAIVDCSVERTLFLKTCLSKTIQPICNNVLGYCATRSDCVSLMPAYFRSCNGTGNPEEKCISDCKTAAEPILKTSVGALLGARYCKANDTECNNFKTITLDCGLIVPVTVKPTGAGGQPTVKPTNSASTLFPAAFLMMALVSLSLVILP